MEFQSVITRLTLCLSLCVWFTAGFQRYQNSIPNGASVPNTCTSTIDTWGGVGHLSVQGGGTRNQFGLDFAAANYDWSVVCTMDSDGDGVLNGAELGDPDCTWVSGANPSGAAISHPAICEPVNSAACKLVNTWVADCPEADVTTAAPTTTAPPVTEATTTLPPATDPPTTAPPATNPPTTQPPATDPPTTAPPATDAPVTDPTTTQPAATDPPTTQPPATDPPTTQPPATASSPQASMGSTSPADEQAGHNNSAQGVRLFSVGLIITALLLLV